MVEVIRPAGGVTSALDAVMCTNGGLWVAWGCGDADWDVVDEADSLEVPPQAPAYRLKRVRLAPTDAADYYDGFANQALWPLFHGESHRVFSVARHWEAYQRVNNSFCQALLEEASPDAVIWLHDYHLCLLPRLLRQVSTRLTIAHFWHIPWPSWEVFRLLPQGAELLAGLLGNDQLGFHIPLYAHNFLECARQCLGAAVDFQELTVTWQGQITRVGSFPISIDYRRKGLLAAADSAREMAEELRRQYQLPPLVGLGVDRLDYTKGLLQRLQALELFFEQYPAFRGEFSLVQIAVPTRRGPGYDAYAREVAACMERINGRFGCDRWQPVVLIERKQEEEVLAAWYRLADLAVVSPVCDGMNLVAKEYVASRVDRPGALVLSRFAGAAAELSEALLVNPSDLEEVAAALHAGLTMPGEEKGRRMAAMQRQVREHDIHRWFGAIRRELTAIARVKEERGAWFFAAQDELRERLAGNRPFFCFDFDGTLAPIVMHPEMACLSPEVAESLALLAQRAPIVVLSGRGLDDLRSRCPVPGVWCVGNHGAELWDGSGVSCHGGSAAEASQLRSFIAEIQASLATIPGVLVEDKGVTASVHYRMVPPGELESFQERFSAVALRYGEELRFTSGKKVYEVRPRGAWDKGAAVTWLAAGPCAGMVPVCMGDDTTDADAFRAVQGTGISISVGGLFPADYYLGGQEEVPRVLELLLQLLT
jgi:trehalose-phosphatase